MSASATGGGDRFYSSAGEPRPYHEPDDLAGALAAQIGIHLCESPADDLRDIGQQSGMAHEEPPNIVALQLEHDSV
jgi:hypothetical protein